MDRAQEHLYCNAFLDDHRVAHAHPDLDTNAEQHTASHLYCLPDPNAAPHLDRLAHAHAYHPAPDMDSLTHAYTGHTASHLDPLANSHAAAYTHSHANIDSNKHSHGNTLKA
jgi:hypothetical protein